jgi:dolichol-phosphate mannosyltransferase
MLTTDTALQRLCVVIPVYNEAESVVALLREVQQCLNARLDYEIIVVDDGSADALSAVLGAELQQNPALPLRVIRHLANFGQSTAIRTGVKAARTDWIVTLDGDGQNDPADIPLLLAAQQARERPENLWLICGHRHRRQDSWVKRMSSRIANAVRSRALGDQTPDTGCALKLIYRPAFLELPFFDHMHRFLPALVQRAGGQVISVRVSHRPRVNGQSKYGVGNRLWVGIVDLLGVLWLRRRRKLPRFEELELSQIKRDTRND